MIVVGSGSGGDGGGVFVFGGGVGDPGSVGVGVGDDDCVTVVASDGVEEKEGRLSPREAFLPFSCI